MAGEHLVNNRLRIYTHGKKIPQGRLPGAVNTLENLFSLSVG
jgi:hypothetical protein